jgi:glycosyltransferase involved in cell wall biosynthesis
MKVILFDLYAQGHHPKYVFFVARHLVEQGDDVILVTARPNSAWDPVGRLGVRLHYFEGNNATHLPGVSDQRLVELEQAFRFCLRLAAKERADIVHHLYLDRSILPLYASMRGKIHPFDVYGLLLWPYFFTERGERKSLSTRIYHRIERLALGRMLRNGQLKGLFVLTPNIRDRLSEAYDNIVKERMIVIPDPVEPLEPMPQELARNRLGLPQKKPTFLFMGNLTRDKGVDVFLEALPLVEGDWVVVVAGSPVEGSEAQLNTWRQELKAPDRLIVRLGFVPEEDFSAYCCAADAVVLPYRASYKGPSGILQHAAAAGKPVIASDVHEIGRIVRRENLGILCRPEAPESLANAMQQFLKTRVQLSEEVRPRALQYAEAHDYRIMVRNVREAYTEFGSSSSR